MSRKTGNTGLSRREFVKALGLSGLAAAGSGATAVGALAAQGEPAKAGAMPRRKLGRTGVEVSALCLGGMFDTVNNQLLLKQALNWGVTYWDTAEAYGNGLSEEGFGRYFTRNPDARKQIFLATKLVPKGGGDGGFAARFPKTLERLHTDSVDLFHVHGISRIEDVTPEMRAWASEMKKTGKIKSFGFSTHANMEDCLLGAAKLDWVDAVMMTYNFRLVETPRMREAVEACVKAGIGLVAMKTQGAGPAGTSSESELKMLSAFVDRGFTDKQAKLKAVWANPNIASICSQMPSLTILSANVAAARDQTALAEGEVDSLHRFALDTKAGYCAGCSRICLDGVCGAVPISEVMRSLMYLKEYGEPEVARQTFAALPEAVRARLTEVDYAKAEAACPQGLAIAELMAEAKELLA